jgi:serine/threonine protein kinase
MNCNNENVVKLEKYLESDNNCYLVMEFCNGIFYFYFFK